MKGVDTAGRGNDRRMSAGFRDLIGYRPRAQANKHAAHRWAALARLAADQEPGNELSAREWFTEPLLKVAAGIQGGRRLRKVSSAGKTWGDGITGKLVWNVVKEFAARMGNARLAPHDLRRTCARLCRTAGGELQQIQFLLGHVPVQTTERYRGCTQRISSAVNDRIGIEPNP